MPQVPLAAATALAKTARWAAQTSGRGGGTTLPGTILLKARPHALRELSSRLDRGSVVVSATNGKTTTTRLITSTVDQAGLTSCTNAAGANLMSGVAAALLDAPRSADVGIFEVDEAALDGVVEHIEPEVVVLMNLFRDQLDRFGEIDTLLERWRVLVAAQPTSTTLILNADDPAIANLADDFAGNIVWFGVNAPELRVADQHHAADSTRCRRCNGALTYAHFTIGHFGDWSCPKCGNHRPTLHIDVTAVTTDGLDSQQLTVSTPSGELDVTLNLPGAHNTYNAAAAIATLRTLGIDDDVLRSGLGATSAAFGRGEKVELADHGIWLHLAKNPAGTNMNIRTVMSTDDPLSVLAILNDRTADGRDVSWIWDVDWEPLLERVTHLTVSGDRCHELALRFKYAGFDIDNAIVEPDPAAALDAALRATPAGTDLHVLPTYTAMLDLRSELTSRGVTSAYWEQ